MRQLFVIVFLSICWASFAQQGLQMDFGEIDSTDLQAHRQIEYFQFVNGNFINDGFVQDFKLPKYSLSTVQLPAYNIGFDALSGAGYFGGPFSAMGVHSNFFHNTEILSQAAYNLGDKFVVGGFSYGSNHVMPAQLTHPQGSYFDSYGSTMFMKYKVSKNVSIETSISVGQNRGVGF